MGMDPKEITNQPRLLNVLLVQFTMYARQPIQITKTLVRNNSSIPKLVRVPSKFNQINSASNVKPNYQPGLYHHPSPSVGIETPDVFLPQNDPRKGLNLSGQLKVDINNAPALSMPVESKYNLTPEQVAEIQELRTKDPETWTRKKLAQKFNVSPFTISLVSNPNAERAKEMIGRLEIIKSSWKKERRLARLDREKRKVLWYRDE